MIGNFINFILHIDKYMAIIIQNYGVWVYLIMFLIVFCEVGLVVIPFLPGDSLLFASGAFAAMGTINVNYVYFVFAVAAVLGGITNYQAGCMIGPKVFSKKDSILLKKEYLDRTHSFYEKHGGIAIILARFMPIIRTFAPFVAGVGRMRYLKFICYNLIGGLLWVTLFVFTGYFFGNIPVIKNNFTTVVYAIIIVSLLPAIIGFLKTSKMDSDRMGNRAVKMAIKEE